MKPTVTRTFTTTAAPDAVFDYLADFTNAEEWDPGTVTCERTYGGGEVGTIYRNVSSFMGRETQIAYSTVELERPTRIHFTGHNEQFDGHDVLGIRAHGALGSRSRQALSWSTVLFARRGRYALTRGTARRASPLKVNSAV